MTLGKRRCSTVTLRNKYWDYSMMQSRYRVTTGMSKAGSTGEADTATLQSDTGQEEV